jgi:hypothetical protein
MAVVPSLWPCVIDSLFRVPWPPEIGVCALQAQHKIDFQHSAFLSQIDTKTKVCVENLQTLEKQMSYGFFICIMLQPLRFTLTIIH